jgi:pimeloyl-ACP methyl ester carboxylesterase
MKASLYAISGLGTDERIFSRIDWPVPMTYLPWLQPEKGESLSAYAARMAANITDPEPVVLLGLSFGGIVAQEIAHIRPVRQLLLLSTIKSPAELPFSFRFMRYLPLYQLSRGSWRIRALPYWAPRFGVQHQDEIELLAAMFGTFSDAYRMWSIRQLTRWNQPSGPQAPFAHLHGSKDHVFPARYLKDATLISGSNHFMVYQQAPQVSEWIRNNLVVE